MYHELIKQRESLDQQIAEARQSERERVLPEMREQIEALGLTAADLFPRVRKASGTRRVGAARYRDPISGNTWTGRGRPPTWIDGRDREQYAI